MHKVFIAAVALFTIFATPALAAPGAGPDYHRHVPPKTEQRQTQSQVQNSQTNDPYWKPCHITRAGYNSCD